MSTTSTLPLALWAACATLLAGASACAPPPLRIPLAVPLTSVGGSRPATPQGLRLIGEFGDGVWGQEQERVELAGGGLGFSAADRIEFSVSGYAPTRQVQSQNADATLGVRGKVRFGDFFGGRTSLGLHVARLSATRQRGSVQNERMTAWDVALPMTFYPVGSEFAGADYRWGVYVAPRLVFQRFEDRLTRETTSGTLAAGLLGVVARWRHVALTGELNFAHAPSMSFGNTTSQGGWGLLPMASVSVILPIGN